MKATKKPPVNRPQCGTYAGAVAHQHHGEHKCEPCLAAQREYNREWLDRSPENRAKGRASSAARQRALADLAKLHPAQFAALLAKHSGRRLP